MNQRQRQRLLRLAKILDTADKKHMAAGEETYNQGIFAHNCGTPACALGHWASDPRNRRRGWRMRKIAGFPDGTFIWNPAWRRRPGWLGYDSSLVLAEFGISAKEAWRLFGPFGCGYATTAKNAAAYIRKFVAKKDRESRRARR